MSHILEAKSSFGRDPPHTHRESQSNMYMSVPSRVLCRRALVNLSMSGTFLDPAGRQPVCQPGYWAWGQNAQNALRGPYICVAGQLLEYTSNCCFLTPERARFSLPFGISEASRQL